MAANNRVCIPGPPGQTSTNQYLQLYTNNQDLPSTQVTIIEFDQIITRNGDDIVISPFPGTAVTLQEVHSYYISFNVIADVRDGNPATIDAILFLNGVPQPASETGSTDSNVITVSSSIITQVTSLTQVQLELVAFGNVALESATMTIFQLA